MTNTRKKLIELLDQVHHTNMGKTYQERIGTIADFLIDNGVTIQKWIPVLCKDCKHGEIDNPDFPEQYYCHEGCGWNHADFFCSYGERKDNE